MGKLNRQERLQRHLKSAVEQISAVMIRLYEATSGHRGADCAAHATLGRALLQDFGFDATLVVGYAGWRIGTADNAAISHAPHERSFMLPRTQGFAYHAWLQCAGWLIDFTTYQLVRKARQLDALDGGCTTVTWSPPFLMIAPHRTQTYRQMQQSRRAGVAYYEPRAELAARFEGTNALALDADDLHHARVLLVDPTLHIAGPNTIIDAQAPASKQLQMLEQLMEVLGPDRIPHTVQRVALHLQARPVPLTSEEAAHLARLLARVARIKPALASHSSRAF